MPKRAGGGAPGGLNADWSSVWRLAHKALVDQGSWFPELRPLLDEYAFALQEAECARLQGEAVQWDRHAKRAAGLADQLALTPRGRKAVGVGDQGDTTEAADPFAALDAGDELSKRREARGA